MAARIYAGLMDLGLHGRRVLVTGSSRGIGAGVAEAFLKEGARVAISGRDRADLSAAQSAARAEFGSDCVLSICGDFTQSTTIRSALRRITRVWGGLDVVVLNLGSGQSQAGLVETAEWERVLQLNLLASMETLRLSADTLANATAPAVVFVGSIAGRETLGAPIAYGCAKAALEHGMRAAARMLAPRGIRVNLVAPGNVFFEGGTWDRKSRETPEQTRAMLSREVPLGRFGTVQEIADAVVFLASPRSIFTTGACLVVDGGQSRS